MQRWKSKIDIGNDQIFYPVYANQHMHTVAKVTTLAPGSSDIELHEWYTSSADHAQKHQLAKMTVLACTAVEDNRIVKEVLKYVVLDYLVKPVSK